MFQGLPNRLYRNRGDRTFEDVSARAGLQAHVGKGMSASFADFDHDGRLDIFVTNDAVPNFLFRNNGDGTFTETALLAGVSVPDTGRPTSSMGVDAQDYDNDGWEDIQFTALTGETFPLFRNESAQHSRDVRRGDAAVGPRGVDREIVRLVLDRRRFRQRRLEGPLHRELARERSHRRLRGARVPPAEQPVHQRRPAGGSAMRPRLPGSRPPRPRTAAAASPTSTATAVSISLSCRSVRPAELWQNDAARHARWLIVRLAGTKSNRDGIGARVIVGNQVRTMTTAMGYASSSHAGLHFGLGTAEGPVRVEVQWPSGVKQVVEGVKVDQSVVIVER